MTYTPLKLREADLAISDQIREAARTLLEQQQVELVIGFEQGSLPLRFTPCFVRRVEDVDKLVWNSFCTNNLAEYLPKRSERVAVVAKGCDARAIIELIKENQISRDQVVIIGVPYHGMVDRRRIESELEGKEWQMLSVTKEAVQEIKNKMEEMNAAEQNLRLVYQGIG